jgi:hypothetical protein
MFAHRRTGTLLGRILVGAIMVTTFESAAAKAADEPPSLDAMPSTVEGRTVSSAEPIQVQVRFKAGDQDVADLALSAFSNDGITATIESEPATGAAAEVPAKAERMWKVRLVPGNGAALAPATLNVFLTAAFKEGKDKPRQRYIVQTVKINAPTAPTVAALAEADIKGSLEALSHERPGRLFVIITNKHSRAVSLTDISINGPKFINVTGPGAKEFQDPAVAQVRYGEAKVIAYDVTAPDQVVPGKYSVVVLVSVIAPDGLSGAVAKTQEIEVAVLGESELLAKLGVPSMLFLPGVLSLLAWQLLWSYGKTAQERQDYAMTATSGTFWVVAVALSIIVALAYPWLVLAVFKHNRDYLSGYGLRDYVYVFALTIISACLVFLLWRLAVWIVAQVKAWLVVLNTPNMADTPLVILKKLARLRESIVFGQAHAAAGNAAQLVFVLEPWRQPAFLWLAPPVQLQATDQASEDDLNFVQRIATGEITDARRLAKRLKMGMDTSWTFVWQPVGDIVRPRKRPLNEWTEVQAEARLIRVVE